MSPIRKTREPTVHRAYAILLLCACVLLGSCRTSEDVFTVFVASSMTEFINIMLPELAAEFPDVQVQVNIAGSGTLVNQIAEGAIADAVLLAGASQMDRLQSDTAFQPPVSIARNTLTVVVSSETHREVNTISDLQNSGLQGAICVRGAPCGALALEFSETANLDLTGTTREPNVKAVLAKVLRGEVDYGFVYRSDAQLAASEVRAVDLEGLDLLTTSYSVALANSDEISLSFLEILTGRKAAMTLEDLGFLKP